MTDQQTLRIAMYAADPPALDAFQSFDPDSFAVFGLIHDALVYIDAEGRVAPGLATSWRRESPSSMVFTLREGVRFHHGKPFDAEDVVATFAAHMDPERPSVTGRAGLSPLKSVEALDRYTVRVQTHFPDGMLLNRMFFFNVYPSDILASGGGPAAAADLQGTGAYRFREWSRGERIVLERSPEHWSGQATVERLEFPILRKADWLELLVDGQLDMALNIDAQDAMRARSIRGLASLSAPAALSHFFLWAPQGPLADIRVRRALNHAVHRSLLVDVVEHGLASPQASLLTPEQLGHNPSIKPYAYDPDLAAALLREAGVSGGFTLRGLVASGSIGVYLVLREFLSRVGVTLEAEVVPRSEWMRRIISGRALGTYTFDGDFVLTDADNPITNGAFHHFSFLFSQGPFSLTQSPAYDERFLAAMGQGSDAEMDAALQALDQYAYDEAMMLFTAQHHLHAVCREGVQIPMPRSGHFDVGSLLGVRITAPRPPRPLSLLKPSADDEVGLLEATGHTGFFHYDGAFEAPFYQKIYARLQTNQAHWLKRVEPMLSALVDQAQTGNNLRNVMASTRRVGIIGLNRFGRRLFVNSGFADLVGDPALPADQIQARVPEHGCESLADLERLLDAQSEWAGAVTVAGDRRLYLNAALAVNEFGQPSGYTYVFSDFSGEEERIRSQAIRRIMDNVPYALFNCDASGRVLEGQSRSCAHFFAQQDDAIVGETVWDLLALPERAAWQLEACLEQVFDDFLPEEVTIGQLPQRLVSRGRTFGLSASPIRGDDGEVEMVLLSLLDVTALVAAEAEVERIQGVMAVMRQREVFALLAQRLLSAFAELEVAPLSGEQEVLARRTLHTFKGELGLFDQSELTALIHEAEESEPLDRSQISHIRSRFCEILAENEPYWHIQPEQEVEISVPLSALDGLVDMVRGARTGEEAAERLQQQLDRLRWRTARGLVGPMAQTCERVAGRLGKSVAFVLRGGDVAVPPRLEPVLATLPHILRNALDHGIEAPGDRGGKPEQGTITLSVSEEAPGWTIVLADDGAGVDVDRLTEKAIRSGKAPAEAAGWPERRKLELLFLDGLSTREAACELSGRGVGMAAVAAAVRDAGGEIGIETARGEGTRFTISLSRAAAACAA